jgi:HAD superfamily hydrolase (TIGR01484 family)
MRPLAELPVDGLKGIFTDVDDTLTHGGALVPAAYQALCDAAAAGLRVVPVTGRPGGYAEVMAALWPVAAAVGENGALAVLRNGEHRWWDPEEVRAEQQRRLDGLVADARARLPFARLADDNWLRRVDVAFDVGERQRLGPAEREAIVALIAAHGARAVTCTIHTHAFYGDHDKARMLVRLAGELWGESPENVRANYIFVGDSPNDQAGFSFFARSVGVANAARYADALSPPPRYLAAREGGHGFAEIVAHVLGRPSV